MTKKKGGIGSSFDDFLKAQGTLEETMAIAVKRVLAWQLEQARMNNGKLISKE